MTTVIFKTSADHLPGVLRTSMYALRGEPQHLERGDLILLAKLTKDLRRGEPQIQFSMVFERVRKDTGKESDAIWGRHWPWLVDCFSLKALARPFNITDHQVTLKDYVHGGTVVYVDLQDHQLLEKRGFFDGVGE